MTDEAEAISLKIEVEEPPPGGRLKSVDDAGNELRRMRLRRERQDLIDVERTEVDVDQVLDVRPHAVQTRRPGTQLRAAVRACRAALG